MRTLSRLLRDQSGSNAVEFALISMLFLVFTLGVIDAGMWLWMQNRAQKAMQVAVRHAVVTDFVAAGYAAVDYTDFGYFGGDPIQPIANVPVVRCPLAAAACAAVGGTITLPAFNVSATAKASILERARIHFPALEAANLEVEYRHVGLGYAGSPAPQTDVYPDVTVRLIDEGPQPLFHPMVLGILIGKSIRLTGIHATMTMEDGVNNISFSS